MGRPELLVLALILGLDLDLAQSWDSLGSGAEPQPEINTTVMTTVPGPNSTYMEEEEVTMENLGSAEPVVYIQVISESINGTHFQTVSCLVMWGRPAPVISWLVSGLPPSQDVFTVGQTEMPHPNGTSSISSTLHFPTHRNDQERVTCEVQHPSFTEPLLKTAIVDTFVSPNVSLTSEMVGPRGGEVWLVSCVSTGGRPDPVLTLTVTSSRTLHTQNHLHLPVSEYEGHKVTCVVHHPKLTLPHTSIITLPMLFLEAELVSNSSTEAVDLTEGQRDVLIRINVTGNVPSYNRTCTKDGGDLPDGMALLDSGLSIDVPVSPLHSGLYQCIFSYHHHTATIHFNITVKYIPVAPLVHVDSRTGEEGSVIECSAADAVPKAEVSWVLPESLVVVPQYSTHSLNGTYSVLGRVLLPPCLPSELTAHCLINHPAFEKTHNRSVTLPVCVRPNITLLSHPVWRGAEVYTVVQCCVDSVSPAASINWTLVDSEGHMSVVAESSRQGAPRSDGTVSTLSSVELLSSVYSGQRLSCVVDHLSLEEPEERSLNITPHKAPVLRASVDRVQGSSLWRAECVCSGEGVSTNLRWILPPHLNNITSVDSYSEGRSSVDSYSEGPGLNHTFGEFYSEGQDTVRLVYLFPLSVHEGQDLSCVHHSLYGLTQTTTVHVPLYARPNITLLSHPVWRGAEVYTVVQCCVDSVSPAASINWTLVDSEGHMSVVAESSRQGALRSDGTVSTLSSVELLSSVYSGQRLSCVVDHLSLEEPEERSLNITPHKAPVLRASVGHVQGSSLWRAECVCSGEGVSNNLSWILPPHLNNITSVDSYSEGRSSEDSYSEGLTSMESYSEGRFSMEFYSDGQDTVRLTYLFPLSVHEGRDLICVHHSLYGLTQTTTVHVPLYARPNITLLSHPVWRGAEVYTVVQCCVDSVSPVASINWTLVDSEGHMSVVAESSRQGALRSDGTVSTLSSVELLSSVYSGQRLSCVVDHLSLEEPEERSLNITPHKAPVLRVSVGRVQDSSLWRAECVCSGEGFSNNLSWIRPPHLNNITSVDSYSEGLTSMEFYSEGQDTVRLTYLFSLSVHEGQNLSCVHHSLYGLTQTTTVHVPLYDLSLKVVNHTSLIHTNGIYRLSLDEDQPGQRVLLQVEGNTPDYTLTCHRSNGSPVPMEGTALVFSSELTAPDGDLYTCHTHFYHHTSSVTIQVEISRQEQLDGILLIIYTSSALALVLVLAVVLWVFCKVKSKKDCKKQECVSALASLVQEPGSPVEKEPVLIQKDGKEYSQLDNFSIVIDVKTTV